MPKFIGLTTLSKILLDFFLNCETFNEHAVLCERLAKLFGTYLA